MFIKSAKFLRRNFRYAYMNNYSRFRAIKKELKNFLSPLICKNAAQSVLKRIPAAERVQVTTLKFPYGTRPKPLSAAAFLL